MKAPERAIYQAFQPRIHPAVTRTPFTYWCKEGNHWHSGTERRKGRSSSILKNVNDRPLPSGRLSSLADMLNSVLICPGLRPCFAKDHRDLIQLSPGRYAVSCSRATGRD